MQVTNLYHIVINHTYVTYYVILHHCIMSGGHTPPTPAAAKYCAAGHPSPPAPTINTDDDLTFT